MSIDSAPWFYVQNSLFFLCLKSNKVCSYTRVSINYSLKIPSVRVYAGIWNGWLPNVPSLLFCFSEVQLRVIAKQRNEFLRATYSRFMVDILRKCYCRLFLLFRFTSPRCRYNLWIFETNAVLVKRTFIWLFYLSSSSTNIGDKSPATSSLRAEPSWFCEFIDELGNLSVESWPSNQEKISFSLGRIMLKNK